MVNKLEQEPSSNSNPEQKPDSILGREAKKSGETLLQEQAEQNAIMTKLKIPADLAREEERKNPEKLENRQIH